MREESSFGRHAYSTALVAVVILIVALVAASTVIVYQQDLISRISTKTVTVTTTTNVVNSSTITGVSTITKTGTTITLPRTQSQTCITTTYNETQSTTCFAPSTTTTVTTAKCSITGQPAGIFFRVLSDSTLKPLTGAAVTAIHNPAGCSINGVVYVNPSTTYTFTTNSTEWIPLDSTDDGSYAFIVNYSGQNYTLNARMNPLSLTCTTLYIPSGRVNSTEMVFKSTCS